MLDSPPVAGQTYNPPVVVGEYALYACIGTGTFGSVFLASEMATSRIFALKQLFTHITDSNGTLKEAQHLRKEADVEVRAMRLITVLPTRGVPSAHRAFSHGNSVFIAMELLHGVNFTNFLAHFRQTFFDTIPTVPTYYLKRVAHHLLCTLRHCHSNGVVHLDVKPDNITLIGPTRLVLFDYGQAHIISDNDLEDPAVDSRLGALAFLPPEILTTSELYTSSYLNLRKLDRERGEPNALHMSPPLGCQTCLLEPTLHHVTTLFPSFSATNAIEFEQELSLSTRLWLSGLQRVFERSKCLPTSSVQNFAFEQGSAKITSKDVCDVYDLSIMSNSASDSGFVSDCSIRSIPSELLVLVAAKFGLSNVKASRLYLFNSRLAIDSWSTGMVLLMCLLGDYPFKHLHMYEVIPAIQFMATAIFRQLAQTLKILITSHLDEYLAYLVDVEKGKNVNAPTGLIAETGPLPTDLNLDLFLLVTGLLHPDAKSRLSISEALGCPWLVDNAPESVLDPRVYDPDSSIYMKQQNMHASQYSESGTSVGLTTSDDSIHHCRALKRSATERFVSSLGDMGGNKQLVSSCLSQSGHLRPREQSAGLHLIQTKSSDISEPEHRPFDLKAFQLGNRTQVTTSTDADLIFTSSDSEGSSFTAGP
ncbi:Kinase [Giardia muris]|uniref:Kinase n=1 Tax=Giardia muris TaxID=5742 RepID=A0A4Z1SPA3_GIAMU|nr:Kinase [Giardia muris]|eukprot:TNJ27470.1 Kinase [Giardia muris]